MYKNTPRQVAQAVCDKALKLSGGSESANFRTFFGSYEQCLANGLSSELKIRNMAMQRRNALLELQAMQQMRSSLPHPAQPDPVIYDIQRDEQIQQMKEQNRQLQQINNNLFMLQAR